MVWFIALGVLVFVVGYVVLTRRAKGMPDAKPSHPLAEAKPVSLELARAMVEDLIAKGDKVFAGRAGKASIPSAQLGPATRTFFSKYDTVRTRGGGFRLASADVRPSEYARGYLSIGHSEDWEVVLKPGTDEVFVVEGSEAGQAEMEVRFPSVYHLVLDEAQRT